MSQTISAPHRTAAWVTLLCSALAGCAFPSAQSPAAQPQAAMHVGRASNANRPALHIEPPESWGSQRAGSPTANHHIHRITLHHQGETWAADADPAAYLRRLQQWSRLTKRWSDIPYHYVVAPDGRVFAARDESVAGDTNTEYDPRGHALIMLLGNFEEVRPPSAQLIAAARLTAGLITRHGLSLDQIATHKDFSAQTDCPGRNFLHHMENGWFRAAVGASLRGQDVPAPPLLD